MSLVWVVNRSLGITVGFGPTAGVVLVVSPDLRTIRMTTRMARVNPKPSDRRMSGPMEFMGLGYVSDSIMGIVVVFLSPSEELRKQSCNDFSTKLLIIFKFNLLVVVPSRCTTVMPSRERDCP